jgi:integrase
VSKARGSVIRRGDRWSVVLDLGRDDAGRRIRKWHAGFLTRDEAEKARTELLSSVDSQTYVAPTKITVRQFAEQRWLPSLEALVAAGKLKPSTVQNYRVIMRAYVLPALGRVAIRELTPDQLARFYGALLTSGRRQAEGGLSPTTVNSCHIAIHRMLKDAGRWGLVARNVADIASEDAPRPARRDMRERVWSPEQLGTFLRAVSDTRLAALWVLVATTGLRRGEAAGLRWCDLDLDAARLTVSSARVVVGRTVVTSSPKTEKSRRTIALDPATVAALRRHRAAQAPNGSPGVPSTGQRTSCSCGRTDGRSTRS